MVLLAASFSAPAQINTVAQLNDLCKQTFNQVKVTMEKSYWKHFEEGKMDTLYYVRWVPKDMTVKNAGENVMCFYKKKDKRIDYVVFQTTDVKFRDKCKAEVKKGAWKQFQNDRNKTGEIKEGHAKIIDGKTYNVTIFQGKQNPTDPISYLIGSKIVD